MSTPATPVHSVPKSDNSMLIILGLGGCCVFIIIFAIVIYVYTKKKTSPSPDTIILPSPRPSPSPSPSPSTRPSPNSPSSPGRTTWPPLTPFGQYNLINACVNINNNVTCSALKFDSPTTYRFVTTDINGNILSGFTSESGTYTINGNVISFTPATSSIMTGQTFTINSDGTRLDPSVGATFGAFVLSGVFNSPIAPPDGGCSIM